MQKSGLIGRLNIQTNELHSQRQRLSILSFVLAVVGIVLMIVEIEMVYYNVKVHSIIKSWTPFYLKTAVSGSTLTLIIILLLYHRTSVRLFMAQNDINNWRLVMTWKWLLKIAIEIFICGIHPIPISDEYYVWEISRDYQGNTEKEIIPLNVILTITMFLRSYLILRVLVLHCYVYDKRFQCILDNTQKRDFNNKFALKYILTVYSRTFLLCNVVFLIVWTSWSVRVCEMYESIEYLTFFSNFWFIAITFLTVGYGEIGPNTICGRFVSIMAGTFGVVCTAYVVAIIAESMQLSYTETYLHRYIIENDLDKGMKDTAASIIQNLWFIKKVRSKLGIRNSRKLVLQYKIKLLKLIHNLKILRNEKIQLNKMSLTISTIYIDQMRIFDDIERLQGQINRLESLTSRIAVVMDK